MVFRAVIFDLFDTLVDLHYEHIPREQFAGKTIPPTARALHAAVADRADVDFETFLDGRLRFREIHGGPVRKSTGGSATS